MEDSTSPEIKANLNVKTFHPAVSLHLLTAQILEQCEQWLNNRQKVALTKSKKPLARKHGFSALFNKRKKHCANKPAGSTHQVPAF